MTKDQGPELEAGRLPLQVEQSAVISGLHEFADQCRGGGETRRDFSLAGGQSQGDVGLAYAAVANGDDVLSVLYVFAPGQLHDQGLVHRGDGQEVEGVEALRGGEARRPDPALDHALVAVDEFRFSVEGGGKTYYWGVEVRENVRLSVQHKCHSVRPGWYQILASRGPFGVVVGGPSAPRYCLIVPRWIPISHSIDRSDIPLRRAF